jgi:hypothetical protein
MATTETTKSEWDISTDIYDIVDMVDNLKKRYVEDEDESTLALGIYGYIGDLEAKKIQSAIILTGELGNEMFPTRAKLDKNITTHAIYQNVTDINAVPAYLVATIGIKSTDLDKYADKGKFVFDRTCPIYVDEYEFHFDYNVILQKTQTAQMATPIYSAQYDMDVANSISSVTTPYLKQPVVINVNGLNYIIFQATLRQVTLEWTTDKLVSDSIIENKTFVFEFSNQLADFVVDVTENDKTTRLTPVFYGAPVDADVEYYCWYLYLNETTVRITFDSASYIPGLNADISIEAQTTLGASGNFEYNTEEALYNTFSSDDYGYTGVNCYLLPASDAYNGKDRKTSEELKKITPKFALSRGYLTTETDLDNYFNLINSDTNRLKLQKKVDNQLERIWYSYFLTKDEYGNIIPTNTCDITINVDDKYCFECEDGRMIVPAGTYFAYDRNTQLAYPIDESEIPELYSNEYFNSDLFYYISVYNIAIAKDPLYAAFYMTNVNSDSFYIFDWVNDNCELQFVANRNHITRKLLTDKNIYTFTFSIMQSVEQDFGMFDEIETINDKMYVEKLRCFIVLYKESVPYRWVECNMTDYNINSYTSSWQIDIETDNGLDNDNCIKLLNLGVIGTSNEKSYGYFDSTPKAYLYILGKFSEEYGRYDLDSIIPGLDGYSVTNRYEVEGGITLFQNYTKMMNTKITANSDTEYTLTGFPMVGAHYMIDEDYVKLFLDALNTKKAYIDECLTRVENSMDIDLKFFNTYGPSTTFTIGDAQETMIDRVDLIMRFRMELVNTSDTYTKDAIVQYIKSYMENINDIGTIHIPNMITDIMNEYGSAIVYIEYMNFNEFQLGVQHILLKEITDPHVVPEFVCIRNTYNPDTDMLEPCIEIECNG